MTMELALLKPSDPAWLHLVSNHPDATVFHHPAWVQFMQHSYGFRPFMAALLDENGTAQAGVPLMEVRGPLGGTRWLGLPFSDFCPPLANDDSLVCELVRHLDQQRAEQKIASIELRWPLPSDPSVESVPAFVLHTVRLEMDPSKVSKRITRQQMQNVRTAEKNNIRVVRGNSIAEIETFYQLHCLNRRKHGVPVQPWQFFKNLTTDLLASGLGFVLLAYQDNVCVSGGVFLHWQKTLTYKYSATSEAHQNLRPNHLVTWTAMQWGCENGYTAFDFGRADPADSGLCEFKRRWGAEETPLIYSYLPAAPSKKGSGHLQEIMEAVIQRSPLWVCRAAGELLYRYSA
jgi:serine/alanine adding enzyme